MGKNKLETRMLEMIEPLAIRKNVVETKEQENKIEIKKKALSKRTLNSEKVIVSNVLPTQHQEHFIPSISDITTN